MSDRFVLSDELQRIIAKLTVVFLLFLSSSTSFKSVGTKK